MTKLKKSSLEDWRRILFISAGSGILVYGISSGSISSTITGTIWTFISGLLSLGEII